jgi:ribosome-binding protein aMBF1 (putative translation factor)
LEFIGHNAHVFEFQVSDQSAPADQSVIKRDSSTDLRVQIGKELRAARLDAEKTQDDVAKAVNMNQSHISEVERGLLNITLDTLTNLASAVGIVPVVTFMPDQRKKSRSSKTTKS